MTGFLKNNGLTRVFTRSELALAGYVIVYSLCCFLLALSYGLAGRYNPLFYMGFSMVSVVALILAVAVYYLFRFYYILIFIRPPKLARFLKEELAAGPFNKQRYIRALPVFFAMVVLFSSYTSIKSLIADIRPFYLDPYLMHADRFLLFGHDPWRVLQPVMGHPLVTKATNVIYNYWLFIKELTVFWVMLSLKKPGLRMRFFWAVVLAFSIEGTLLAVLLSSGGPCYYERIVGSEHFAPLMNYLAGISPENHIWALKTQDYLWNGYLARKLEFGSGISAMPSLHVASAFLLMMVGWKSNWFWKVASTAFYLSILIGSVHLAWHYAVDGYVATLITALFWFAAGKITSRGLMHTEK